MILFLLLITILNLNTPNERLEQDLLKPPEQVYEMNSSEMSKLEHETDLPQEKPKKKQGYKLKSAKYNPAMRMHMK